MSKYILSTMGTAVSYAFFDYVGSSDSKAGKLPVIRKKVTIYGGAGMPSLRSGFGEMSHDAEGHPIWTAAGVVTAVSDADYEALKDHALFQKHLDGGYVSVLNSDITGNHKAVAKEARKMEKDEGSMQLNKERLKQSVKVKTPMELEQETGFRL